MHETGGLVLAWLSRLLARLRRGPVATAVRVGGPRPSSVRSPLLRFSCESVPSVVSVSCSPSTPPPALAGPVPRRFVERNSRAETGVASRDSIAGTARRISSIVPIETRAWVPERRERP